MIFLERIKNRLTMAIIPKDDLATDKKVIGDVFLQFPKTSSVRKPIIKHNTGYFLFIDFPEGKYNLIADGKYYQQKDFEVDTSTIQPARPFVELLLEPKAIYPFPEGMTVLKGKIVDKDDKSIFKASITVKNKNETAISEENGDFFIKFDTINKDTNVTLIIMNKGYETKEVEARLRKNTTTHIGTIQLIKT